MHIKLFTHYVRKKRKQKAAIRSCVQDFEAAYKRYLT